MRVDISGLDKAAVLLALYNHANYSSHPFNLTQHKLSTVIKANVFQHGFYELAEEELKNNNNHFTGVNLGHGRRALNVTFQDNSFDSTTYDLQHGGLGSAQKVIDTLRLQQEQASVSQEEQKQPRYTQLLEKVGSGVLITIRRLHRPLLDRPLDDLFTTSLGYQLPNLDEVTTKPNQDGEYHEVTNSL